MTWMILNNGAEHHFIGGSVHNTPASYDIATIAHSLAQINRYTGHCTRPYSVAEHSLLVADLAMADGATPIVQLAALMHDAHESLTGDAASPVKWAIGEPWANFEHHEAAQLHNALGLRTVMHSNRANIRRWDLIALATERRDLTAWNADTNAPWPVIDNPAAPIAPSKSHDLKDQWRQYREWTSWKESFLIKHEQLRRAIEGVAA